MPTESQPFLDRMREVEALVAAVEEGTDPAARAAAQDLVRTLLDVHAAAIAKMLELLPEAGHVACATDELVSNVLLLHDLHPLDLVSRVRQALARVRPLLTRGGGQFEALEISADRVRIRLDADPGCESTVAALRGAIQRAILDAAPEVAAVEIEGFCDPAPALMQIGVLSRTRELAAV